MFLFLLLLVPMLQVAVSATPDEDAAARIAPEKLARNGLSDEAYAFKQQVYRLHVARGAKSGRPRIFDLPPAELAVIPGMHIKMQRKAAAALGQLLAAANVDLAHDLADTSATPEAKDRRARAQCVQALGVNNAYRSASEQFAIWNRNFNGYYQVTATPRRACAGGEHGAAAAQLLRDYIGVRVAAPGYSNHQGGIAVDFALLLKPDPKQPTGKTLGASMAQSDPWKVSWFWRWLVRRAGEFGFVPYAPEAWHWEYKPDQTKTA